MPRLRGGNAHAYNIIMDAANARLCPIAYFDRYGVTIASKNYKFGITSNGAISTESGAVLVEKSVIKDVQYPVRNNQTDPANAVYTGKIRMVDTIYSLDGSSFHGGSDTAG